METKTSEITTTQHRRKDFKHMTITHHGHHHKTNSNEPKILPINKKKEMSKKIKK
jgi:hypothetical protein